MSRRNSKSKIIIIAIIAVMVVCIVLVRLIMLPKLTSINSLAKPDDKLFLAPGINWNSKYKVEDYFVTELHMTKDKAVSERNNPISKGMISLRLRENTTIDSLSNTLLDYGFIRDKQAFLYALKNTKDVLPGHADPIKIGDNTIDIWASYRISEDMTAWEIADTLLNHPTYFGFDDYNKTFIP